MVLLKKAIIALLLIFLILIFAGNDILNMSMGQDVVASLEGRIFFLQREQGVLNLYAADAQLTNIKLVYSHRGQGEENENIIEYCYDKSRDEISFMAMKGGNWGLFSIKIGEESPRFIRENESWPKDFQAYVKPELTGIKAINKRGSLYLSGNGEEIELKHYYGIYDSKFSSGYFPLGFSPDGKYLLYSWNGHLTPVGAVLECLLQGTEDSVYIIDLESCKSNYYIAGQKVQWIK